MDILKSADKIIEKIPEGLSELEKARYIYIQLGKLFVFDEKYWLGNEKSKKRIYKQAINSDIDIRKIKKGNKSICVSISKTYKRLLKQIGIRAEIYKEDFDDPHVFCAIFIKGRSYKADLQRDLKYIQAQRKTRHFGNSMDETMPSIEEKIINNIDEKIGYEYLGEEYILNNILRLKKELEHEKKLDVKVEKILETIKKSPNIEEMGYVEKIAYYDWLISKLLSIKEKNKVKNNFLKKERGEEKKYAVCISVGDSKNGYSRFLYKQGEEGYKRVKEEELISEMNSGMIIIRDHKIPGIKKQSKDKMNDER